MAVPVPLLTNSGDYAESSGNASTGSCNKPANVAVGDLLVGLISFQTALAPGATVTEGTGTWAIFGPALPQDSTRRGATTWALQVTSGNIGSLPASWTWTNSTGGARFTMCIFRVTGVDLSNGLTSALAGTSVISTFTAGNTGNAIPTFTVTNPTRALVVACAIAQNTSTQTGAVSWTVTGYTTHPGSYEVDTAPGGVSWSCHYIATKTADPDGTEDSVQQVCAPVPANAQSWAIAIAGTSDAYVMLRPAVVAP